MKDFNNLIQTIGQVHQHLQSHAANSINQALTIRNWLIGYYIVEFELRGKDRAQYGSRLLVNLANKINIKGLTAPELSRCRQFYERYPQILGSLTQNYTSYLPDSILGSLPQKSSSLKINPTQVPPNKLLTKLSFTHFTHLLKIDDHLKRTFYEIECIKGTWSVRELKRQIASLYYERRGLSNKPEKLSEMVQINSTPQQPVDIIKNIYAFDFLDINTKDRVEESDLESALLDNLQGFIIELGHGFCFEARQKRILIGEKYYFIDLVFYHRILKSHILIELKMGEFQHGDIGQLNTYLNYFKEEISEENDNLPVGILLVAEKDHALVKYATAGMDENLFIQQYLVNLPDKNKLEKYINDQLNRLH